MYLSSTHGGPARAEWAAQAAQVHAEAKIFAEWAGLATGPALLLYAAEGFYIMADNTKSFSEQWREIIYQAHVNFLRKRNLFEEWKKFKANKKLRQDDFNLMSEFIRIKERVQQVQEEKS